MKNEYKVTKALFKSWAKEYHLHGTANIIFFVLYCLFAVIGISGLIFSIALQLKWITAYIFALVAILSIYRLFFARFVILSKRYKIMSTTYGVTEWTRTVEFLEDEIVLTDHSFVNKFQYENVKSIKEKGNVIFVYMNHNMAIRLYRDAFVEGSWEACKALLTEKKPK